MRRGIADRYSRTYPWTFIHNAFNEQDLERIDLLVAKIEPKEGLTGAGLDKDVRRSLVRWIDPSPTSGWLFQKMDGLIESLNDQFYGFQLYGYDTIQHTTYNEDDAGCYDWHIDMELGQAQEDIRFGLTRKLSASIVLNDDFEGGQFQVAQGDNSKATTVEASKGSIIVFPSWMHHRVTPVTKGVRKSLVVWCLGSKFV